MLRAKAPAAVFGRGPSSLLSCCSSPATVIVPHRYTSAVVRRGNEQLVKISKGPGGRSSVTGQVVTVFGATGFLGRYLVNNLGRRGNQVVIPYRGNVEEIRHLKLMGDLGQIVPLRFDLRNEQQIVECMRHSDVVYNLIGRDYQTKNFTFEKVNIEGAQRIAKLAKELGVPKFIHFSALSADEKSPSSFLRTKALGEQAVRSEYPDAIVVRPGRIYGHEDKFWNRLSYFVKFLNFAPILNGGRTKLNPVLVNDVAKAVEKLATTDNFAGKTIELYGSKEYFYLSLVEFFCDVTKQAVGPLHLTKTVAKTLALLPDFIQTYPLITPDEIERLYIDDKMTPGALTFEDLGIKPLTVEETIGQFARLFRSADFQKAPLESIIRKYTTDHYRI